MKQSDHTAEHHHSEAEERLSREAALDETLAESFPASDPLSTDPNPDAHDTFEKRTPAEQDAPSTR